MDACSSFVVLSLLQKVTIFFISWFIGKFMRPYMSLDVSFILLKMNSANSAEWKNETQKDEGELALLGSIYPGALDWAYCPSPAVQDGPMTWSFLGVHNFPRKCQSERWSSIIVMSLLHKLISHS